MATNTIGGRTYARAWMILQGVVLLLLGLIGLFLAHPIPGLHLEGGENITHWILGIVALAVAFGVRDDGVVNTVTLVYAIAYIAIGLAGFGGFFHTTPPATGTGGGIGGWHVYTLDNIAHLLLGVVSFVAWWMSRDVRSTTMTGRPAM